MNNDTVKEKSEEKNDGSRAAVCLQGLNPFWN